MVAGLWTGSIHIDAESNAGGGGLWMRFLGWSLVDAVESVNGLGELG